MNVKYNFGIVFVILLLLAVFNISQSAEAGSLDGKTYKGEMGEKGKTNGNEETIEFKDGRFHSASCDEYGFTAAPYTSETKGDLTRFSSVTISQKEGKMNWTGIVKGDMLEATATWNKEGQPDQQFWVKGQLEK